MWHFLLLLQSHRRGKVAVLLWWGGPSSSMPPALPGADTCLGWGCRKVSGEIKWHEITLEVPPECIAVVNPGEEVD